MPELDVSEVVLDPMFSEQLAVQRITQVTGPNGRATQTTQAFAPWGVVNMGSVEPTAIEEQYEHNKSTISVHAFNFRFLGPTSTTQPDRIVWQGIIYLVRKVYDYSKYGIGFTAADCEAVPLVGA